MRVFISHSKHQLNLVNEMDKKLREAKITVVRANLLNTLGPNIYNPEEFEKEVGHCDHFLVVITNTYLRNEWLMSELNAFMAEEGRRKRTTIVVPLVLGNVNLPLILKNNSRTTINLNIDNAFTLLKDFLLKELQVFVVMKIGDNDLDQIYLKAIRPAILDHDFKPVQISYLHDNAKISQQILSEIRNSQIVIADLTFERPNCYFEVGYALALGKNLILTSSKKTIVHFDLYDNRRIVWEDANDFRNQLSEQIKLIKNKIYKLS